MSKPSRPALKSWRRLLIATLAGWRLAAPMRRGRVEPAATRAPRRKPPSTSLRPSRSPPSSRTSRATGASVSACSRAAGSRRQTSRWACCWGRRIGFRAAAAADRQLQSSDPECAELDQLRSLRHRGQGRWECAAGSVSRADQIAPDRAIQTGGAHREPGVSGVRPGPGAQRREVGAGSSAGLRRMRGDDRRAWTGRSAAGRPRWPGRTRRAGGPGGPGPWTDRAARSRASRCRAA